MCEQASLCQNMANMTTPMIEFIVINTIHDYAYVVNMDT
jgi:hypothetical protein